MMNMKNAVIIFDIDGTLANNDHRQHFLEGEKKDWNGFYSCVDQDKPIREIGLLCRIIATVSFDSLDEDMKRTTWGLNFRGEIDERALFVVFVTGRPERLRSETTRWLTRYVLPEAHPLVLHMRADGDHRPDWQVKQDILNEIRADGTEVLLAIDDRKQVVDMWRRNGIRCLQCAEGDF